MKADYLTYQFAASRSLLGLAIQLTLAVVFLVYGILGRDSSALTAAYFMFVGVPAWLVLAILFDQHRRERIEAIEAEAFAASDAATSSVFESRSDELRLAARRLKAMYRFMIPAASLAIGAALVGIGIWRFTSAQQRLDAALPPLRGWAIALGLGAAFVGFLYARYIAAMAKQKAWANLRAGAAFIVGAALMGLAMAAAHFIHIAGQDAVLRYLPMGLAVVVIALGAEIFLNFVLDIYRPRKPGEHPRPAFESRILGLAAAPDRIAESIGEAINYQFGYDVSGSWFYRLLSRSFFRVLVPVGVLVMWAMTTLAVIRPHEKGLVLRFGEFNRVIEPGLNFKWPWPVETVQIPVYTRKTADGKVEVVSRTVTGVRTLDIGSLPADPEKPILWTNEHASKEVLFLVQPGMVSGGTRGRDLAVLAIEVPVHYAVADVRLYEELAPPEMRDDLLRSVAQRELVQYVSSLTVNDLLSGRRVELGRELRRRIENAFASLNPGPDGKPRGAGVEVLFVGVNGLHPPKDTAMAFEQVVEAQQKYQAKIMDARAQAVEVLTKAAGSVEMANAIVAELDRLDSIPATVNGQPNPQAAEHRQRARTLLQNASGTAATLILEASADRWRSHMGARAALAAYRGQLDSYRAAPGIYRAGLYLDALRAAMSEARVFITDSKRVIPRFNMEDRENVADIFRSNTSENQ